ncbi:MAG: hypothetical protein HZB41_04585 [Ignavibacteriae bacterium]|nr:hypothetical protein [Ignavibacteriota bacterium]
MEATGDFYPLETYYDKETNTIKGKISGPGEFIIGTIELLEAPTAIFPTDNSSNIDINTNFLWQGLSSNAFFRFQLSYNSDFSDLLIDSSNITDNHLELVLRNGTEYYWHVKAQTGSSQSNWSNINKFITKDANQVAEDNDQDFTIQQENDYLQIKLNYNTGSIKFQIYDLIGNIVKDENYVNPGTGNLPGIFCNDMNYGVYFYKISLAGNEKYGKLYIGK